MVSAMTGASRDLVLEPTPLVLLSEGQRGRIAEIRAGRKLTRRLLSLGLRVGMELHVLQRRGRGVVVGSSGSRVALGAGVAEKLLVIPLDRQDDPGEEIGD